MCFLKCWQGNRRVAGQSQETICAKLVANSREVLAKITYGFVWVAEKISGFPLAGSQCVNQRPILSTSQRPIFSTCAGF